MNLRDQVVVITGASRGLGRCLAEAFAKRGAKVVVSGRDERELREVAAAIGGVPLLCDVTDEQQVIKLVDETVRKFGRIDVMVNNAGIWIPHVPVEEVDTKRVHDMMAVNFFGTLYGAKAALTHMLKQGSGAIVNIISTSGLEGRPGSAGYCATKFAVAGFTKSLAMEAQPKGIGVFGIYPGGMKTHLFDSDTKSSEDYRADYMDPAEVAEKIVTHLEQTVPAAELIIRRPSA